jgi:hypothetical protein
MINMERKWKMESHLEIHEIFRLALAGAHHEHLDACVFCQTEYQEALDLLAFEASEHEVDETAEERLQSGPHHYRLAAQDTDGQEDDTHVRRTWYLENGTAILRAMEYPERSILYGHLIIDPVRYAKVSVRFSGLMRDFRPDQSGVFEIGPSAIEIERMDATLIEG